MRALVTTLALALTAGLAPGCSDSGHAVVDTVGTADAANDAVLTDTASPGDTPSEATVANETTIANETTGADGDASEPETATVYAPDLQVDPATYTFSYLPPLPNPITRQVILLNAGNAPLDITQIAWAPGGSPDFDIILIPALPKTLAPGKQTFLNVRFRELGGGTSTLHITSNDPDMPVTTVAFASHSKSSTAHPEPCVALTPTRLDFGVVQRGNTKTMSATLTNCGTTSPLKLSAITRSSFFFLPLPASFQIVAPPQLPLSLAPGASLPVDVTYTPLIAGLEGGSFVFTTDDPNQPNAQLDVSGISKEPPLSELGLHIKIAWDTSDTDEDSHLIAPGGTFFDCTSDCFFGNPSPDWGVLGDWRDDPFLDVDDVDGHGPENINISEPVAGTYQFKVHYYADSHEGFPQASKTTVEVWSYGALVASFGPTSTASTNWTWDVFTIDWPSASVTTQGQLWQVPSGTVSSCGFHLP